MKTSFFRNMLSTILNFGLVLIPIVGVAYVIYSLNELFTNEFNPIKLAFFFISIIYIVCCFILDLYLLKILYNIDQDPFVKDNVRRLRIIGYILTVHAIFMLFQPIGNSSMILILSFNDYGLTPEKIINFIIASVCLVIADVFDKAIKIKDENDLTI